MGKNVGRVSATQMLDRFRARFWQSPRPHGEIIENRTVSFLELFYDLVYVVLIARAAHTLAHHITWRATAEFAVVFGLIWIAWLNGTLYHELHSRQDGRTRTFVFVQMTLLAVLAVYTGDAAGADGKGFAFVYTLLLLVLTWLWYAVRRIDPPEYRSITGRYLAGMLGSSAAMAASVALSDEARVWAWAAVVVGWIALGSVQLGRQVEIIDRSFVITESLIERFGLFTIIVLGEVVVGVVNGVSEAERGAVTIATGLIGLQVGFGFWWTYFDFVGRREPHHRPGGMAMWIFGHLPLAMSIAAAGAALVSLVEHATDDHAPAAASWLLTGSAAVMMFALAVAMRSLLDYENERRVYPATTAAVVVGGVAVLAVGAWRPAPLILVICVLVALSGVWWFGVDRWIRHGESTTAFDG